MSARLGPNAALVGLTVGGTLLAAGPAKGGGAGVGLFDGRDVRGLQPVRHLGLALIPLFVGGHLNVRRLRKAGRVPGEGQVWTRHGSTRYLPNERALIAAAEYVHDRQGEPLEPGPLTGVARRYDRAARTPYRVLPSSSGQLAADLRHAVRQLGAVGVLTGRGQERLASIALLLALAGLVAEIAAWQHDRGRTHQAAAARDTARELPALARTSPAAHTQPSPAPAYQRPDVATRPLETRPQAHPRGHRR